MSQYDAFVIFMPLAEAQAYFNHPGDVTPIEVYTADPDRIECFRQLIAAAAVLRPIHLVDWRELNAPYSRRWRSSATSCS
jgi:lipoprotein-releasing system permease protein